MSGIAGFVSYAEDVRRLQAVADTMARRLTPRGPDDGGGYADATACLVHRRLAVADPAGGKQPMASPDGNIILIYNGELYNTEELRHALYACGHTFAGRSDTEVLLHAFMEWGAGCLPQLNGMYAFAVWDKRAKALTLARDRLGVKPLFYSRVRDGLVFASELKALLCHPGVRPQLDQDGLRALLLLGPARMPGDGVFKNVHEVLPGHYAVLQAREFTSHAYWTLEARAHPDSPEQTAEHTRWLVEDAVRRQLEAGTPPCAFLSGGLASSAMALVAARQYEKRGLPPLHTWSAGSQESEKLFTQSYFEPDNDDTYIEIMANLLGTAHHTVPISNAALCAALLPATDARDLPGMADVDASLLLLCSQVKKGGACALSSVGADALFGDPWPCPEGAAPEEGCPPSHALGFRLSLLQEGVVEDAEDYVRGCCAAACAAARGLEPDTKEDARRRKMFQLGLQWFLAPLLEGSAAKGKKKRPASLFPERGAFAISAYANS
ncbi:asparagine synthase (glutamine-hydrolyzing) [Intestinibacillus massiliensis]|nr:asparagine synthase (glutamine-hydrolyzing) [Intestinibacillus massiliensis]